MASHAEVKNYLAYWFQLGKGVIIGPEDWVLHPQFIFQGDRYSPEFERYWQQILDCDGQNCYLEGTEQTIDQLLSSEWEMLHCGRCEMPVPVKDLGNQCLLCPCHDVEGWPNLDLPQPRSPVNSKTHLKGIQDRLQQIGKSSENHSAVLPLSSTDNPGLPYAMRVQLAKQNQTTLPDSPVPDPPTPPEENYHSTVVPLPSLALNPEETDPPNPPLLCEISCELDLRSPS